MNCEGFPRAIAGHAPADVRLQIGMVSHNYCRSCFKEAITEVIEQHVSIGIWTDHGQQKIIATVMVMAL
jgi:hypothetical protein